MWLVISNSLTDVPSPVQAMLTCAIAAKRRGSVIHLIPGGYKNLKYLTQQSRVKDKHLYKSDLNFSVMIPNAMRSASSIHKNRSRLTVLITVSLDFHVQERHFDLYVWKIWNQIKKIYTMKGKATVNRKEKS